MNRISFFILIITLIFGSCNEASENPEYNMKYESKTYNEVTLEKVIPSECQTGTYTGRLRDRIISKSIIKDTLILQLGFKANCCIDFYPGFKYVDNTLYVILDNRKDDILVEVCDCNCCYELSLFFTGISDTTFTTKLKGKEIFLTDEKYVTYPEEYEIFKGDTINRINKYGQKTGIWKEFNDSTKRIETIFFYSGELIDQDIPIWYKSYYPNGNISHTYKIDTSSFYDINGNIIQRRTEDEGKIIIEEFYLNGQRKCRCRSYKRTSDNGYNATYDDCDFWNKEGYKVDKLIITNK